MFRQLFCIILIAILFLCIHYIQSNTTEGYVSLSSEQSRYNIILKDVEYIKTRWPIQLEIGKMEEGDGEISFHGHLQTPKINFVLPTPPQGPPGPKGNPGKNGPNGGQGLQGNSGLRGYSGTPALSVHSNT